ncbi:MAG: hypothetical protein ACOY5C_09225 [Pseudomonadota bacterium]
MTHSQDNAQFLFESSLPGGEGSGVAHAPAAPASRSGEPAVRQLAGLPSGGVAPEAHLREHLDAWLGEAGVTRLQGAPLPVVPAAAPSEMPPQALELAPWRHWALRLWRRGRQAVLREEVRA